MGAKLASLALPLSVGFWVMTELFAYAMRLDPVLGVPLYKHGRIVIYGPWAIVQWAWWWGAHDPSQFLWPAMLGLAAGLWVWTQTTPQRQPKPQAQWATLRDLKRAECLGKTGVVLGVFQGRILRYHGEGHVFFVGRTRAGKTLTLLSTLLECRRSMLINDVKEQLYLRTAGYRGDPAFGRVVRLNPVGGETAQYNPWDTVRIETDAAYRDVEILSHYLVEGAYEGSSADKASSHFKSLAKRVLNGVFLYGMTTGIATCGEDFNDLLTLANWEGLMASMREHDHPEVQRSAAIAGFPQKEEFGSMRTTLANALGIFCDPRVARMTRESTFQLSMLREEGHPCTVYWQVPFEDQDRLRPLTRLVMHQALAYCTRHVGGWRHPLLAVLEELPSLEYFPLASKGLNYFAEYGVQLLNITPSMEEVKAQYGLHHNFLVGSHVQCVFGLNDAETAETFSDRLGTHEVTHRRASHSEGRRSTSEETRDEALLTATGLLQMDEDGVLILAGRHAVLARQARYFQHRTWQHRSQLPVPTEG